MDITPALSSKCLDFIYPDSVTTTLGSKDTKSPTLIPSFKVSSFDETFSSILISILSAFLSILLVPSPCTCEEALVVIRVPVYVFPSRVSIVTCSPSTVFHTYPPS